MRFFNYLLDLFFPPMCVACEDKLTDQEQWLCLACLAELPKTNFYKQPQNLIEQLFAARIPFERAVSHFYFVKNGKIQKIIHELKYENSPQLGIYLGRLCGEDLLNSDFLKEIDYIVPVPLHPKREKQRGYNQCLKIAEGLSEVTKIPLAEAVIERVVNNKSQTKKTKSQRLENVAGIFNLTDYSLFSDKHILLIDDIVTTGATLEECAKTILKVPNAKITIFTLAMAL